MRFPVLIALASALFASTSATALALPPASLDMTAKVVDFYYNRFIVTADGNVRVRLSDGTVISGQTFSMDLKLNRYLIAGDVHLDGPTVHETGAAFAGYPDIDRSYFLTAGAEPSRETFFGIDWAHPTTVREQPGDAFYFPDLGGERPYIIANGARIVPKTNVLFNLPRILTAGVYIPLPRYVVTFSANSHFFENTFFGGNFDVGVPFNGSAHSLTALHLRDDDYNGIYLAFDQHFVWDQDYIAFGIDPLTQQERQYNLVAYKRWTPKLETHLFVQESAAQAGIINRPTNAAGFAQIQVAAGLRGSNISYTQDNYYQYLLGFPPGITNDTVLTSNFDPRWREHPVDGVLAFTGGPTKLFNGKTALYLRPRAGVGFAHDAYGEGGYPNEQPGPPDSIYHYFGGTLYTSPLKLTQTASFSASYDRQRQWYNLPHNVDMGDLLFSIADGRPKLHLQYYVAYEIKTTDDYWGSQQLLAYTPSPDFVTTAFGTFGGQAAFRGLATSRGYTGSLVYSPTAYFVFKTTLQRFYDTPAPVPGLYGQPPWQLVADVRFRLAKQIMVDVTRGYYFNFADERWTPQLGVTVTP
ncbi:MAG TPA: hypothetical protein VHT05_15240 [Candidatus Elarobacter sp.]|jgi:hypothetical protein|nr:hypothetical protein [Candidatus Elarobacter sp.]